MCTVMRPAPLPSLRLLELDDSWILHPYCIADGENVISNWLSDDLRASQCAADKAIFGYIACRGIEHHECRPCIELSVSQTHRAAVLRVRAITPSTNNE